MIDITLLLSRGKDARVSLKYMLDAGVKPRTLSFYRKKNPLYPFTSFLREWTDDYDAAFKVKNVSGVRFQGLKISNEYLLHHLDRIVALNHGTPLHWEFLAAAEAAAKNARYIATGFVGDVIAGKSHHHYLMKKIRTASEYGMTEFEGAGSKKSYESIVNILKQVGFEDIPTVGEMAKRWQSQYHICRSNNLDLIFSKEFFVLAF